VTYRGLGRKRRVAGGGASHGPRIVLFRHLINDESRMARSTPHDILLPAAPIPAWADNCAGVRSANVLNDPLTLPLKFRRDPTGIFHLSRVA